MPSRSQRLDNLPPYVFSVINDRLRTLQAEGARIIRLDIGNPDLPPPDAVIEALSQSAHNPNNHGYTGYRGTADFRQAIAAYVQERFDVMVDPDTEVLPVIGSKEGVVNLSLAYLGPGDVALVPDIGYPAYAMGTLMAGGEVAWIPLRAENGYQPDVSGLSADVLSRAKLMWINYPNNPTGAVIATSVHQRLADFCAEHDILLVSDNPYLDVVFDDVQAGSALQASKQSVLEFLSFSKSYNMAGWRLGAAVGNADAIRNLLHVKSNMDSGHFKAIYDAGIVALKTPQSWIDARNQHYQERRDRILATLPEIGLSAKPSQGSLYVWATPMDYPVLDYIEQALLNAHVSIAPGEAYGPGGKDYMRLSIAVPDDQLNEALNRLKKWYSK